MNGVDNCAEQNKKVTDVETQRRENFLAETNTYHENIPNSKTACVRTERQQVGTK